jgi:hypothetical protein
MGRDADGERGIVTAFYVTNARAIQAGVTEAAFGQFDGRPMVFLSTPVETMAIMMDPDTAISLAERLQSAAKMTVERRAALLE